MTNEFVNLKDNFVIIKNYIQKIEYINNKIHTKINLLEKLYTKLSKNNKKSLFIFGLDTFHFQKILLKYDYDNQNKHFLMISNRIYSDYYKLSKIINKYFLENINNTNISEFLEKFKKYPKYDNLDIYKNYGFTTINNIFYDIVDTISYVNDILTNKELELQDYKSNQDCGININNFVVTFEGEIITIKNQIKLFINYIKCYNNLHKMYLKRYLTKIKLNLSYIEKDITIDDKESHSSDDETEYIVNLKSNLQNNIDSETSDEEISENNIENIINDIVNKIVMD